jgi:hypothetical protein
VAMSSATPWPTSNGVLAEFTFQVQSGQIDQYCWPIQSSGMQLTSDGFEIGQVAPAQICYVGRDALPANLTAVAGGLLEEGFRFTLQGDLGAAYSIEASTNLLDWTPLITVTNSNGSVMWADPAAAVFNQRFYRAKQP